MCTNTGKSILDSGGAYGRHFERNQVKSFSFHEDIQCNEYGCTIPIHVYMDTMFETNKQTAIFNKMLANNYYWDLQALDVLAEKFDIVFEGNDNTYNRENDLSQDFQFTIFEYEGDRHCIFQLHNGCDVRGGYTSAQVFKIREMDYFFSWICDFYDDETDTHFETFYQMSEDDSTEYDTEKGCWLFEGREIHPFSSAMGF